MKKGTLLCFTLCSCLIVFCQNTTTSDPYKDSISLVSNIMPPAPKPYTPATRVYKLKPAVDVPVTVAGVAWTLYAFTKIYSKDTSTRAQVLALNRNDVASINRFGTKLYSPKAFDVSNAFFYGSMPFPLVPMLDKHIRKDAAKVGFLWLESLAITGTMYTVATYVHDKYRPYAYNPAAPIERRIRGGAKNSFYAGHVALVGTSTFFTAKVFADYHPHSNIRWLMYGAAAIATGTTAYLRVKAGEHFLTDALLGTALGTATGILVPHFHKNKMDSESKMSFLPYIGREKGIAMLYKF